MDEFERMCTVVESILLDHPLPHGTGPGPYILIVDVQQRGVWCVAQKAARALMGARWPTTQGAIESVWAEGHTPIIVLDGDEHYLIPGQQILMRTSAPGKA